MKRKGPAVTCLSQTPLRSLARLVLQPSHGAERILY